MWNEEKGLDSLIEDIEKKEKGKINYLPLLLLFLVLLLNLFLVIRYGVDYTAYAVLEESGKIDENVIDALKENGEARVIVILEEPGGESDKPAGEKNIAEKIEQRKDEIRDIQQEVISNIENPENMEIGKKFELSSAMSMTATREGVRDLADDPKVRQVIIDEPVSAFLSDTITLIEADSVHQQTIDGKSINGSGIVACVIDTGIDYTHSAFGGCSQTSDINDGSCAKVIGGYDFVQNDSNPLDDNGHGTHIAGIIASQNQQYTGIAPGARLVAIKSLNANGSGYSSDVLAGIEWCVNNASRLNISVISMSLGTEGIYTDQNCPTTFDTALSDAQSTGIFVAVAAGNNGDSSGINHPACSPYVISVGATDKSDVFADFSNSYIILDVVAPGKSVVSTVPQNSYCTGSSGSALCSDTGYRSLSGTSQATPHVAGVAALVQQYEKLVNNRNVTPAYITGLIKTEGKPIQGPESRVFPRVNASGCINSVLKVNSTLKMLEKTGDAKIEFQDSFDMENASLAFDAYENFISLNSTGYGEFNRSAKLTLFNLTYTKTPIILKNGAVCSGAGCIISSYNGTVVFNVSGFTNYSTASNSMMQIYDDNDQEGGMLNRSQLDGISFFANYTNRSSGQAITTAECNISISDGSKGNVSYNAATGIYSYSHIFDSALTFSYNISCVDLNNVFEPINASDSIDVLAGCGQPPAGLDFNVTGSSNVTCNNTVIFFRNQTLRVTDNASFALINSTILLNTTNSNELIIVDIDANFTSIGSNIKNTVSGYNFNLQINGYGDIMNTTFNSSQLDILGNRTHMIFNDTFYDNVALGNRSENTVAKTRFHGTTTLSVNTTCRINDSFFYGQLNMRDSAHVDMKNTTINATVTLQETSLLNMTLPKSNITSSIYVIDTPTLAGSVDMNNSAGSVIVSAAFSSVLSRIFPIYVNYTNSTPMNNSKVNVTNGSRLVFEGNTNELGLVEINLTFDSNNDTAVYGASVNPTENISAFADTPIEFTLDIPDTSGPTIHIESPANSSTDTDGNMTFYYNASDATGIENCSLVLSSVINRTNSSITMNITQNFTLSGLPSGNYNWSVQCYDNSSSKNLGQSGIMDLIVAVCGDSIVSGDEQCDGNNLNGQSCTAKGFDKGNIGCTASCTLDLSDCSNNKIGSGGGSGGGGGGSTSECAADWNCGEWSGCVDGKKARECSDANKCSSDYERTEQGSCAAGILPENPPAGNEGIAAAQKENDKERPTGLKAINFSLPSFALRPLLWILLPLLLLLFLFLSAPEKPVFAEEEVLKELIEKGMHKKYFRIHVMEELYEKYRHHGNIGFKKYIGHKHKPTIDMLKEKHGLDHELAHIVALAHHHAPSIVLTKKDVPAEVKKKFRWVKFIDPFKK